MIKKLYKLYLLNEIDTKSSALAFYFFTSTASLLLILTNIISYFSSYEQFKHYFSLFLTNFFPKIVQEATFLFVEGYGSIFSYSTIAILILIYSSTSGFVHLQESLVKIVEKRKTNSFKNMAYKRIKTFLFIVATSFVLLVFLYASFLLNFVIAIFFNSKLISIISTFVFIYVFFIVIYRYLLIKKRSLKSLMFASLVSSTLYLISKLALDIYFINTSSIIHVMIGFIIFVYLACNILFVGALFIRK